MDKEASLKEQDSLPKDLKQ
jgi:hypothetical protein